jgi:hypothetical protein
MGYVTLRENLTNFINSFKEKLNNYRARGHRSTYFGNNSIAKTEHDVVKWVALTHP